MKITIIGTGYVGLVTGTCLAELGNHVVCVDKDEGKITKLGNGNIPIYEPGLNDLVGKVVAEERLSFTSKADEAIGDAEAVFIAVGTPESRRGDGYADLTFIYEAAREVALHLSGYTVVINKSTVPVGTAREVERIMREANLDAEFDVVSNPEFLREGAAINDFMRPDRVVVGTNSERAVGVMEAIYEPLYLLDTPIVFTTPETAELIKYAANAFLAVKISYINEIANLCEVVGADISAVSKAVGMDGRIGGKFLHPGPGYGGSCFPKDTNALVATANENDSPLRVVEAAMEVNKSQKPKMMKKIVDALGGAVAGKRIAVLGVTFKPETDDMRESPAISIVTGLIEKGAIVKVFDPKGMREAKSYLPEEVEYSMNAYGACEGADVVVLMTEWNQFRSLDLGAIKGLMKGNLFIDLRNVYHIKQGRLIEAGFRYACVGQSLTGK